MTKSELIAQISEKNPNLTQKDVERIVNSMLQVISNQLKDGGRIELRNFGTFDIKHRSSRIGRNPKTGEKVNVPAKTVPFFKAGKLMRQRLNED